MNPPSREFPGQLETPSPEIGASQTTYIAALAAHADAVGAMVPSTSILRYPSPEEQALLSRYNSRLDHDIEAVKAAGKEPLFRDDIIDPDFCRDAYNFSRDATGGTNNFHWYKQLYRATGSMGHSEIIRLGKWDAAYTTYMFQRRAFHAAFMMSIARPDNTEALDQVLTSVTPITLPAQDVFDSTPTPRPEHLYNRTNWLCASLISAMMQPPEHCNAIMKRRAIETCAALVDPADFEPQPDKPLEKRPIDSLNQIHIAAAEQKLLRLPWSMQLSTEELRATMHPRWRHNSLIRHYLGDGWNPKASGNTALLQERPKDYIQVLLLGLYSMGGMVQAVSELLATARLTNPVKDIIFAEDASFVTVYKQPAQRHQWSEQQLGLDELLMGKGELDEETLRLLVGQQRLRLQEAAGQLAAANAQVAKLSEENRRLAEALRAHRTAGQSSLFGKYGMDPAVDPATCEVLVKALRRARNKRYHPDSGTHPDAEKLQVVNGELDQILRLKGLKTADDPT